MRLLCPLSVFMFFAFFSCGKDKPADPIDPTLPVVPPSTTLTLREQYSRAIASWPTASWDEGIERRELAGMVDNPNMGKEKPALIALGKALFWDNNVGSGTRSCLSCHNPENYWTDAKRTADGIATHHRNTPTMQNVWALEGHLFHDGRAKTFREQIAEAIESPIEMGGNTYTLPAKLQAVPGYVRMYEEAYGTRELTREGLLDAIAAYSKTINSGITAFDRFVAGDYQSLNDEQIEGLHLFRTKGQCINCHNGPFFTDLNYHNLGYAVDVFGKLDDGRYIVTKNKDDLGKIRTPGLRNVVHTAPYMHNGSVATLPEIISLLSQKMPQSPGQQIHGELSPHIKSLKLSSKEQDAILAFLNALSSERPNVPAPELPAPVNSKK